VHKIIRSLVISDLFILSSYGLIQPIFSIFILQNIVKATITDIGVALTIELFTRSLFQIIIAKWADEEKGNCRELYTLFVGSLLISIVPLGYLFSTTMTHIFIAQFLHGLGQALSYPSWRVLFTRYVRQEQAGYEWGIYDTVTSLGIAGAATLGAYFADKYSFSYLFIMVSTFSFLGTGFIMHIFNQEFTCRPKFHLLPRKHLL
jgi:DHA1 family quinolone resistance protein-like MFS transporter